MNRIVTALRRALPTLALLALAPAALAAQDKAPATLHGHTNDPGGAALKSGDVRLLKGTNAPAEKDRKYPYTFPIDANGDFKGDGIAPGEYIAFVYRDNKSVDYMQIVLKPGEDRTLNFDMTRAEYMKGLSEEDRKVIEEAKKKNAGVNAENAKIADINKTLLQARADIKGGKPDDAIAPMTELTTQRPTEGVLWATLGEAQLASADQAVKAAKAAKTSPTDPAITQKYTDAAASFQKGIDLNAASKKPNPDLASAAYLNMGQALAKSGKTKEASDAYEGAVKASPGMAAKAFFNESVVLYNASKNDEAAAAADKAIAADPKNADAYYIKGQALVTKAAVDPKTQKVTAPPACVEAYQQYLELAPTGPHAQDVKDILAGVGAPVKNSIKNPKR